MINTQALLIPFIALWFARVTGIPQRFIITNRKPFTCPKCMGLWLSLIYQLYLGFTLNSVFIICLTSMASYFLEVVAENLRYPLNP